MDSPQGSNDASFIQRVPSTNFVQKVMKYIVTSCRLQPPPLNTPLILERITLELSLPPEILSCVFVLLDLVPLQPNSSKRVDRAQIMAYVIVAMKLVYGFDDKINLQFFRALVRNLSAFPIPRFSPICSDSPTLDLQKIATQFSWSLGYGAAAHALPSDILGSRWAPWCKTFF